MRNGPPRVLIGPHRSAQFAAWSLVCAKIYRYTLNTVIHWMFGLQTVSAFGYQVSKMIGSIMEARAATKRRVSVFGPAEWGLSVALVIKLVVLAILLMKLF